MLAYSDYDHSYACSSVIIQATEVLDENLLSIITQASVGWFRESSSRHILVGQLLKKNIITLLLIETSDLYFKYYDCTTMKKIL